MGPILIPFLIALAVSAGLVPLCRKLALRFGYLAQPSADRWHRRPTALLGGVAIGVTLFGIVSFVTVPQQQAAFVAAAFLMFIVGLTDDIIKLRPSTKLIAEIATASVFLFFGYRLGWTESMTLDAILTIFWVVGITNAFNLLDNMDGLCAGITLVAGSALMANMLPLGTDPATLMKAQYLAVLLGATAGFLIYNFHPASIFMGDSGSLLIGVSMAALTLGTTEEGPGRSGSDILSIVAAPVLVLLIPILDTTLVTVSRMISGRSAATGGSDHTSHRLVSIGLSERAAVAVLWSLAGVAAAAGVAMRQLSGTWPPLLALLVLIGMMIVCVYLAKVRVYEGADAMLLRQGRITPLVVNFMYKRRVAEVLLDLCLVTAAYYSAYRLMWGDPLEFRANFAYFLQSLPVVVACQMVALFVVGAYRGVWQYFGLMDTVVFAKGVALGWISSQVALLYLYRFTSYSRGVFVVYAITLLMFLTTSRASFRLMGEFVQRRRYTARRLIIYGAGDGGALAVRELLNDRTTRYRMLGFIDDDPKKYKLRVHGYAILGAYEELARVIRAGEVDHVVVSVRNLDPMRLQRLEGCCEEYDVTLSRLHLNIQQLVSGPRPRAVPDSRRGAPRSGA